MRSCLQRTPRQVFLKGCPALDVPGSEPTSAAQPPTETIAEAARVGWGFISLYTLAYISTCLLFLAPALVSLALRVNSLVGIERAPSSLALIASSGALLALFGNTFFGRLSDRTTSSLGRRRPWLVAGLVVGSAGILVVALAPSVAVVLVGWCVAQRSFNAVLAALAAVMPDRVPVGQRGLVAGILGVSLPIASVVGTFLVKLFSPNLLGMFVAPCVVGGFFSILFAVTMNDPRHVRGSDGPAEGLCGRGCSCLRPSLFLIAAASDFNGFLVGMAIGGLGFGLRIAVDLALVVDVLPDSGSSAKDLGVLNIAGALPNALAPALAPAILAFGGGSCSVLYAVAGVCALLAALALLRVKGVR